MPGRTGGEASAAASPTPGRRLALLTAALLSLGLAAVHAAWALGSRWGYSACGFRSVTAEQSRTGCGARAVDDVGFLDGWAGMGGWLLVSAVAVRCLAPVPWVRLPAIATLLVLLVISFPLHLLFEIPVGLSGEPTDWRRIAFRSLAVVVASALLLGVRRPRCGHGPPVPSVPLSRRGQRAVTLAVTVPLVAWVVPHLSWMCGLALGISPHVLADGRHLPLAAQVAITFSPAVGAALSLGIARPWGRRVPGWMPGIGGRAVPRLLVLLPGAGVALLLAVYGLFGWIMMGHDLMTGETSVSALVSGWAVFTTEVAFVVWGAALGIGVLEYARATRCTPCAASSSTGRPGP